MNSAAATRVEAATATVLWNLSTWVASRTIGVDPDQQAGDDRVGQGTGDDPVNVVQPVLQDGHTATAGVPFAWAAADEAYGDNGPLREWLEGQQIAYVLAVCCDHRVPAGAGHTIRADRLAGHLPARAWQRLSAGAGAKGQRWYDWAWVGIGPAMPGHRWLLIRRSRHSGELAYYRCYCQHRVPLATLVTVDRRRHS